MKKSKLSYLLLSLTILSGTHGLPVDIGSVIQGDEPILHVERFGRGTPVSISNGYLFIDFKYIPPPYVLERVGQAVTVNKIIVNCLYTNAIPDTLTGVTSERLGSDGRMHTITSPPHPASWLQGTADAHVSSLSNNLNRVAIFLPGVPKPFMNKEEASLWKPRNMPVKAKITIEEFPHALLAAVSSLGEENYWKAAKDVCARWSLSQEDTILLVNETKVSPVLMERLQAESALVEARKQPAGPSYARLSSEFSVVNMTGYEWKLTVRYDDGMECYIGRDMEIRDILFGADDITVEAYRDDRRYPLPKTKRIRVAPKLQATIKSCKTGQTFTAGITDSLGKTISIDDVKYQVVDIRADSQTVLLKNCSTGERLLVLSKKASPKIEAK